MIRPKQAKKILPKSEFESFEAVIDNQHSRMSEARLKQKAKISRRLRDKYRDLARHQTVAAKKKLTNNTDVSHHEARAEIFQELTKRIETEIERPNRRPTRKKKAAPTKVRDARTDRHETARELSSAKKRS